MADALAQLQAAGAQPALLLDHTGFARRVFAPDQPDDPVALMSALSQANQLLAPDGHWISLLDLVRHTGPGRAALAAEAAPLARLRALFENPALEAALNRLLQSAQTAANPGMALVLDFASPADWIGATGATPEAELDDLDAEDIAVFQSNLALRLDLAGIAALSVDGSYPITGALADTIAPLVNFAGHHGLDFALLDAPEDAAAPEGVSRFATTPWEGTAPQAGLAFVRVPPESTPETARARITALRRA